MTEMKNLLVGLAYPDSQSGSSGRFGGMPLAWQNDAKHYEFWVRGNSDGSFSIPNVRPGTYELHAIADGILGEFSQRDIVTKNNDMNPTQSPGSSLPGNAPPGPTVNLGPLTWHPVRFGRQLWDIGIPNRDGSEFLKGDDYFHWGMYLLYAQLFPHDVDYTIGKSDYRKDWYFEQVPHATSDNGTGRSTGRATPWTIRFTLPQNLHGRAILRLAIAGVGARSISVAVNGRPAGVISGLMYNATINRDGIGGAWVERDLAFDASLLHPGPNAMTLTIPAGGLTSGVIYDYLRLELQ
jgi:rhamnogalacturonan endolyase